MIGIIDYGAGNLKSVAHALARLGESVLICRTPQDLADVRRIILPGVGHYRSAVDRLLETRLAGALQAWHADGRPILGICLGLQLLFESSAEAPDREGLGFMQGHVRRLRARCSPHMGWNDIAFNADAARWSSGPYYFAHGYAVDATRRQDVQACATHESDRFAAVVCRNACWGVQFHPERSGSCGLELLKEFLRC